MCLLFCRLLLIDIFNFPPLESVHSVTLTQMSKCSHAHQDTQNLRIPLFVSLWLYSTLISTSGFACSDFFKSYCHIIREIIREGQLRTLVYNP